MKYSIIWISNNLSTILNCSKDITYLLHRPKFFITPTRTKGFSIHLSCNGMACTIDWNSSCALSFSFVASEIGHSFLDIGIMYKPSYNHPNLIKFVWHSLWFLQITYLTSHSFVYAFLEVFISIQTFVSIVSFTPEAYHTKGW